MMMGPRPRPQRFAEISIASASLVAFLITFILPVLLFIGQPSSVSGFHASGQCVQLGQANTNPWAGSLMGAKDNKFGANDYTKYYRLGYWTIGARKFDVKFNFLDFTFGSSSFPFKEKEPDYTNFDQDKKYRRRRRRRGADSDLMDVYDVDAFEIGGNLTGVNVSDPKNGAIGGSHRWMRSSNRSDFEELVGRAAANPPPSDLPDYFVTTPGKDTPCPYKWRPSFDVDYQGTTSTFYYHPSVDFCPEDDQVEIKTYAVRESTLGEPDRVLNGWLYFEVELEPKKRGDQLLAVYVQVRDEFFNAIGEFVADPREQCSQGPNKDFAQPTPYQVLPCSAVGFREAKISNALFMARYEALKYPARVNEKLHLPPDNQMKYGIRFTWRLSEYWCNRHLRFRPEAIIFTKKMAYKNKKGRYNKPFILRKAAPYWIRHKWFGAADIKREHTNLSCGEEVINYKTGKLLKSKNDRSEFAAPWLLDESVESVLENDYMHPKQWTQEGAKLIYQLKSCHANTRETYVDPLQPNPRPPPLTVKDIVPTFSGRCTHHYKKTPSHESWPGCNLNRNGEEFKDLIDQYPNIQKYSDFVHNLTWNRTQLCTVPCHPPTIHNLSEILSYKDRSGESNFTTYTTFHNDERLQRKYEQFYSGRKYHAFLCIYWTMFFMPVGIFIARYLKETFMNISCIGGHLWFWVHLATSVAALFFFVSSLTGLSQTLDTWGRSLNPYGKWHRGLGYTSISLFLVMMIIGGFRGLHMRMRYVMMTIHSVIGFLIYLFNLITLILSAYIPASPAMGDDCLSDGSPTEGGKVLIVISIWIVMDGLLHAAMNILQCMTDRSVGIHRRWWCPIIPILPADAHEDMVGSFFRKMTMLAYGLASFIMANTAGGLVWAHVPKNETCLELTGPTTCDKPWGCSSSAKGYIAEVLSKAMNKTGQYIFLEW